MPFHVEDIAYSPPLLGRLYRPEGAGPFPALVEIHGGAWTGGDRLNNVSIAEYLAERGVMVFSIDFRMPPAAGYPGSVADINFGIRWFKANAARLVADPTRIGALGTSSGGHMLLLNVLRPADPRYTAIATPGTDASVVCAIACWPVADPVTRYQVQQDRGNDRLVAAHHAFWPDLAAQEEGSPTHILARGETVATPPLLIMQGTVDDNLTPDMADRFATGYSLAGGRVSLEKFPGQQHAFIPRDPDSADSREALALIHSFVRRHLG